MTRSEILVPDLELLDLMGSHRQTLIDYKSIDLWLHLPLPDRGLTQFS